MIAVVVDGRWRPGMDAASPWAWVVIAASLAAAVACAARSRRGPGRAAWSSCAALCLFLAADKALDLQNGLSQAGRSAMASAGLSAVRRPVQAAVLGLIAASAVAASAIAARRHRGSASAIVAALVLIGFYAGRCLSLHQVDAVLSARLLGGPTVVVAIELAAATAVVAAARASRRR